jgi:hypothetical protein
VHLIEAIHTVTDLLRPPIEATGQRLHPNRAEGLPPAPGDPERVAQIRVTTRTEGACLRVDVQDTG